MSGIECLAVCIDDSNDPMPVCSAHDTLVVMDTVTDSIGHMEQGMRLLKQWQDSGCGANYVLRHATLTLGMPVREGEEEAPGPLFDFIPAEEVRTSVIQRIVVCERAEAEAFCKQVRRAIDDALITRQFQVSLKLDSCSRATIEKGSIALANAGYHVGPGTNPLHISWAAEDPFPMPF